MGLSSQNFGFRLTIVFAILFTQQECYSKKLVCVIGAGPSGLFSIKHLADHLDEFQPLAFERRSDVGGVWIYSDSVETDVLNPMYRSLRATEPREIMINPEYREFHFESGRCPPHESVHEYLKNYTKHFNLRQFIKFDTVVEKISRISMNEDGYLTKWLLETRKIKYNASEKVICDAVIVGTGTYNVANIPAISGIERFSGRTLHSSAYRKPEDFINQRVIILGAAQSGIDIAVDLSNHVKTVFLSHRHGKLPYQLPSNVIQVAGVIAVNDNDEFLLQDGSTILANTLIFCTGYKIELPSLDVSTSIEIINGDVYPLHKATINIEHPSMAFVGFDRRSISFSLPRHIQASYIVSLFRGKFKLPPKNEMFEIANSTIATKYDKNNAILQDKLKWKKWREMAEEGQFEPLPEYYEKAQSIWNKFRINEMVYFKDYKLLPTNDGNFTVVKVEEE